MTFQTTHAFARTDRSRLGVWWWTTDHWLLGATAVLMTVGVLLSFASSTASGSEPLSSTASWKPRSSNRSPSAASARLRSSRIFSSPTL